MQRLKPLHFDGWTLDPASGELARDDVRVRLQRQPQLILEELLARPGEVVTREELTARLWPRAVVEFDMALNSAVRRLRAALRDDPERPRYIETVPRRGYRYVGPLPAPVPVPTVPLVPVSPATTGAVSERQPDSDVPPQEARGSRPWRRVSITLLVLVVCGAAIWSGGMRSADKGDAAAESSVAPHTVPRFIAVLPFADPDAGGDQGPLARALAQDVLRLLGRVPGLRVTASGSSFDLTPGDESLATIARRLEVTHVLVGNVRRSGDRVRVSVELFDAATNSRTWSQAYERRVGEMPALQAEIATAVADELRLRPPASADGPVSSDAYERYVLARHLFWRRGPGDAEAALRGFSDVVAMEPDFAAAWAGLASANWIEIVEGRMDPAEGLPRVRKAAERALALDPRLSEAHLRLALFHRCARNPRRADEHVARALEADPNDPLALMIASNIALRDGRIEDAVGRYKRAVRVDPLSAVARHNLSWLLFRTGQTDQARVEAAKLLELYPGREDATSMLCLSLVAAGRHADALAVDQRLPSATPERAHCRALALAGLGRSDLAHAALRMFVGSSGVEGALQVAEFYAQTGDVERAFDWLHEAVQRDGGRIDTWMIRNSPLLGPLRRDARWDALLAAAAADRA